MNALPSFCSPADRRTFVFRSVTLAQAEMCASFLSDLDTDWLAGVPMRTRVAVEQCAAGDDPTLEGMRLALEEWLNNSPRECLDMLAPGLGVA